MEDCQQPISTQQVRESAVTSQPVSPDQALSPKDGPDSKQAEDKNHLTLMSDNMETSKRTCPHLSTHTLNTFTPIPEYCRYSSNACE